jgi:hypothetical protein
MFDWQPDWLKDFEWTWSTGVWGILLGLAVLAASSVVVIFALVKLPATYFLDQAPSSLPEDRHLALRWARLIGKNLLGVVVALLGGLLSLPGIPGPGLFLILIGMTLLDFPGKRRLERKLVGRPGVLRAINSLRERFGKPPLVLDGKPTEREGAGRPRRPFAEAGRAPGLTNAGK